MKNQDKLAGILQDICEQQGIAYTLCDGCPFPDTASGTRQLSDALKQIMATAPADDPLLPKFVVLAEMMDSVAADMDQLEPR